MNTNKSTRLIRIAASAAMLSLLPLGITSVAEASPGLTTNINIQAAVAKSPSSDAYAAQVLTLINQKRAAAGSKPVKWNQNIGNVSQDWAEHLGRATMGASFDWNTIHRSDAGGSLLPSGATWYREIIAFNGSAQSIVDWWMGSPGHKAAMLDPKATDIGIGYVVPSSGPYAGWHQVVANLAAYPGSTTVSAGTQYKTTIQLNLRSGGGFEYPVIGSGVMGTIVTATGKTNGIWYEVKMGSQTGWMSSEYLSEYAAPAAPFNDLAGNVFVTEITWMKTQGISTGYADGTYRPFDTVNREQMAAFMYRMAGSPAYTPPSVSPFVDVPTTHYFYKEITWMKASGVSTGWADGTYRPYEPVIREAMAAFMQRYSAQVCSVNVPANRYFTDANTSVFASQISWMGGVGVTTGYADGTYRPFDVVTREQMAAFMYRLNNHINANGGCR